jgi:hypothetical protein
MTWRILHIAGISCVHIELRLHNVLAVTEYGGKKNYISVNAVHTYRDVNYISPHESHIDP